MKITTKLLRKINACDDGVVAFQEHFPSGEATWDEVMVTPGHEDWKARLGRECPADIPGATWEARLALQRNDAERAWLGRRCPRGVEGDPR